MEQRLTIIGLGVEDLVKSTAFYEDCFGWRKTSTSNENISFFQLNGILLSLYPADKLAEDATVDAYGQGFKKVALAYNARSIADVDALFEELARKKVTITKMPEKVFWGGYSGYISDPDGHLWEIAFNPYLPLDAAGNVLPE